MNYLNINGIRGYLIIIYLYYYILDIVINIRAHVTPNRVSRIENAHFVRPVVPAVL